MSNPHIASCLYVGKYQAGALAAEDGFTGRIRQTYNTLKLARVVSHQSEAVGEGDGRNHQIVGPDGRTRLLQLGANLTVRMRTRVIEGQ